MIGDEPTWLVNLIITIAILPILIGSLGEHVGTETLLTTIILLFLVVGVYTLISGQLVNPPRPKTTDGEGVVGPTYENPLAVHQTGDPSEGEDDVEAENADGIVDTRDGGGN